jgi:hypothetical protein
MAHTAFKGSRFGNNSLSFQFQFCSGGNHGYAHLGEFKPEQAASGARLYDAAQILIRGPRADINFEWSSYTQADIQRAVDVLQAKGVDVQQVIAARQDMAGSEGLGVQAARESWRAQVTCCSGQQQMKHVRWHGLPSAEAAARQADCGFLAVKGLGCAATNFPASAYSQLQLQEAGEHAVSKGVEAALVRKNLKAVEKVRG